MVFYDKFLELCRKKGVAPTAVVTELGLGKSNVTYWKKGSMPKNSTLKKIADYFNVTVDDLLTGDLTSDLSNVDNQQVSTIEEALINLTRCFVEMPKELQEEALKHLSMLVKVLGAEKNSPQNESPNNPPEDEK